MLGVLCGWADCGGWDGWGVMGVRQEVGDGVVRGARGRIFVERVDLLAEGW